MIIYLFRHGETDWNKNKRMQGQLDIPLNDYGRELAVKSGEALKEIRFDKAFCSPLDRARETAQILLGDRPLTVEADKRLLEINVGAADGGPFAEMRQDETHPLHNFLCHPECYVPQPDAESFEEVRLRGQDFIKDKLLPLENQCENVLIVAHGAFNRALINSLLGIPVKDFWKLSMPNCAAAILELKDGQLKVLTESIIYYDAPANSRP